jgi:hypothetical protein
MITRRNAAKITAAVAVFLVSLFTVLALAIRYLSPADWAQLLTSPRHINGVIVSYQQLRRMTADSEQRKLWNYEILIAPAPAGQIHFVYAPRIKIDPSRQNERHPGAHIRIGPGIETHVFLNKDTLKIQRAYFADQ